MKRLFAYIIVATFALMLALPVQGFAQNTQPGNLTQNRVKTQIQTQTKSLSQNQLKTQIQTQNKNLSSQMQVKTQTQTQTKSLNQKRNGKQ